MFTNVFRRFLGIFIEKTTFEDFDEIYEQISEEQVIQNNDDKEIIDSTFEFFTNFW